jgi:hypothetical protein
MPSAQKGGGWFDQDDTSYVMENGVNSGVLQYVYYFVTLIIILIFILVIIHFTIKPIFRVRPGDKGLIGLPGTDDSKIYWQNPDSLTKISDKETPLGSLVQNWSMMLDIQIDNPTANTDRPRILFTRGQDILTTGAPFQEGDTILTINPKFNLCIYLDRLTNDLFVAVQTNNTRVENTILQIISIPNVPVRKAFSLGVFVGSRVLEVYINGLLVRSKAFTDSILNITGNIQPPLNSILSNTARVSNLRLWARPLSPGEFRQYGPPISFTLKDISDSCVASNINKLIEKKS